MGRGRAKAKQQRVARELKYGGPDTDLDRLAAELSRERVIRPSFSDEEPDEDKYAEWIETSEASEDVSDEAVASETADEDERR